MHDIVRRVHDPGGVARRVSADARDA